MKWNTPGINRVKKYLFSFLFFFLFLFVNASAQSKSHTYRFWEHPAIKALERHDPAVVAFTRAPRMLVNLCIVDTVKGMAYYVSQYGFIFDTLRLTIDRKKQIQTDGKQADPFRWFEDSIGQYFPILAEAKEFLRQNGNNFKKASSVQQRLFSLPPIKEAPSTLAKLLVIEDYERAYKGRLWNFNWRISTYPDTSVQKRLREGPKPGSLVIYGSPDSGYSEYISEEQFTIIRKARLEHATGEIRLYDWENKAVDSFFINKNKVAALVNAKTDVFALYHAWLEWNLQQINAAIPAWQYAANYELLKNKGHFLYADIANQKSGRSTLAGLQQEKKKVLEKVNALSDIDAILFRTIFAIPTFERLKETRQWNGQRWIMTISPLYRESYTFVSGQKRYELTDHRGNVVATVSDKKKGVDINNDGTVDVYEADVTTATDYYPFGSQMPERKYSKDQTHRYGFNGKENDNEVKGDGNQQDYGMRIYDPRVGRFLSLDPITSKYPMLTPYQFASNTPIAAIDIDGKEAGLYGNGAIGASGTPLSNYFGNEKGREQWGKAMAIGTSAGGAIVVDVFFTKGWLTRTLLASQVFGAFEHNRAKTPEGRQAQDQRSKEAFADAFITWGGGKILGVSFNVGVSVLKGLAKNRFNFAKDFYKAAGYNEERILSHTKGIDLSKTVKETTLKKGVELEQWTYLDKNGNPILGHYYTLPNADPTKLGIPLEGRVKTTVVLAEDTKFLESTAGDIENWLKPGEILKGGEKQLFQTNVKVDIKKAP